MLISQPKQTSLRHLQDDVLWPNQTLSRRLEKDVWFRMSWRRPVYDVLKTSDLRRLKDVWFRTSWRRLIYIALKTSNLQCLEDVRFTSSSKRPIYNVFRTSVKRRLFSNVVVTSLQHQKESFFLILYCLKYSEKFKCSCLG